MKDNVSRDWNVIVVNVTKSIAEGKDMMTSASLAWKISDEDFLNKTHYVCAQTGGVIVGVYEFKGWYKMENFNVGVHYLKDPNWNGRVGFVLTEAPAFIRQEYIGKSFGTIPTSPIKFIRSKRDHRYDQEFAPDWYSRWITHRQKLLLDETREVYALLDANVNDNENFQHQTMSEEQINALVDEILAE